MWDEEMAEDGISGGTMDALDGKVDNIFVMCNTTTVGR